jgi:hypothetical protein
MGSLPNYQHPWVLLWTLKVRMTLAQVATCWDPSRMFIGVVFLLTSFETWWFMSTSAISLRRFGQ